MTHNVTVDDLSDYIEERRSIWQDYATSASAGKETKRLQFSIGLTTPMYQVLLGKKTIYIGVLKETAVREYNALS
jgi:N-glycosylase/DNA lyase